MVGRRTIALLNTGGPRASSFVLGLFLGEKLVSKVDALFDYPGRADFYRGLMIFFAEARGKGS